MTPEPFRLHVPDAQVADLRERLARTRYPDEAPGSPQEAQLNGLRQFTVPIRGIPLHFIHEPGRGANPIPLLLSHGWPGSIVEFRQRRGGHFAALEQPEALACDITDFFSGLR